MSVEEVLVGRPPIQAMPVDRVGDFTLATEEAKAAVTAKCPPLRKVLTGAMLA